VFPNYQVSPAALWRDQISQAVSPWLQKIKPLISLIKINPITGRQDGIISVTTRFNPAKLETHIGGGFSGGPALQNDIVVGIIQASSLQAANITRPLILKGNTYAFLSMWSLYLGGQILTPKEISPFCI
jgi:hypothetical protein